MLLSSSVSFLISHCVCKCVRNDLQQTNWNVHSLAASINRIESNRCELNLKHDLLQLAALFPWIASHACSTTIYCRIVKKCSQRFFHRCVLENGLHLIQYRTLNLDDCIRIFNLRASVRLRVCKSRWMWTSTGVILYTIWDKRDSFCSIHLVCINPHLSQQHMPR